MSFTLAKGNRSPSLADTIRVGGEPFDLTGCSAKLKMRPELAAAPLKVDATAQVISASTTLTGAHALPSETLAVASTTGFLDEGAVTVGGQIVFYNGKTATTLLGCTRGFGTVANGAAVAQIGGVRYDWAAVDVDTAGDWRAWFEITLPGGNKQDTPELDVTIEDHAPYSARALCSLVDVLRYIPGYQSDPDTDEALEALIAAESQTQHQRRGREFVAIAGANPRLFEITPRVVRTRHVRVGDLATITTVRILEQDETTLVATVAGTAYEALPRIRQEWEPIRKIGLRATTYGGPTLAPGRYVEVTGTWGFPQLPENVRQAVAKLVIVRYLSDVAFDGTSFADAVRESEISVGALLRSANEALANYGPVPFA